MEAIRETIDVIGSSVTIHLPDSFMARRVEVIVLPASDPATPSRGRQHAARQPSPELAGTLIHDDLIEPAVSADDWDALK